MSQPAVTIVETDGNIGTLPVGQKALAIVGTCSGGSVAANVPGTYASSAAVITAFGKGPLVEAACYHLAVYRTPVLLCKTGATVAGAYAAIDLTAVAGTASAGTTALPALPIDDGDLWAKITLGGVVGTGPISYQNSYDGGRTYGPVTSLGTATDILFTENNSAGFDLTAANTVIAGDIFKVRVSAPVWNGVEITAALEALRLSAVAWDICEIVGPIDATTFATIGTKFAGMPEKMWVGGVAVPTAAQTEATYLSALTTAFSALSTTVGVLCAGAAKITGAAGAGAGRSYRRSITSPVASFLASVTEEVDLAAIDLGTLPGVAIRDANGNPDEHDESANPGLDDARFTTLRTFDGVQGVFVNNCRLFSASGSDFEFAQHRRIMNLARATLRVYFTHRLSKPITVDAVSGFIIESEAREIEAGADAAMRGVLLAKPLASGGGVDGKRTKFVQLSRTDNILSTKTLTVQASVIPLAYPKAINVSLGFRNPATQILKA